MVFLWFIVCFNMLNDKHEMKGNVLIKSSEQLVKQANKEIETICVEKAKTLLNEENTLFVDLRDIRELEFEGRINGAMHAPRGMIEFWIDPNSPYFRKEFASGKKLVFFCAAGWRSALTTKMVQDMGLKNVCHMGGGFSAWKKANGEIIKQDKKEENIDRDYAKKAKFALENIGFKQRLVEQISFIMEIDKLKQIWRQTPLLDNSRKENDAEHSWQLAMMAIILAEYASDEIDILIVLKMLLIHDIVEIDAGDNPAYSNVNKQDQYNDEAKAAKRLFTLLPPDLAKEFRLLWEEFEAQKTANALFAKALDRLQPFLHNYFTDGQMWLRHEIAKERVVKRMEIVKHGSPTLHELIEKMIKDAQKRGFFYHQT